MFFLFSLHFPERVTLTSWGEKIRRHIEDVASAFFTALDTTVLCYREHNDAASVFVDCFCEGVLVIVPHDVIHGGLWRCCCESSHFSFLSLGDLSSGFRVQGKSLRGTISLREFSFVFPVSYPTPCGFS